MKSIIGENFMIDRQDLISYKELLEKIMDDSIEESPINILGRSLPVDQKTQYPLRRQLKNQARNWGIEGSPRMKQHDEGIWWFMCSRGNLGHDGYLVCDEACPEILQMPYIKDFKVHTLPQGSQVFAFDDEVDACVLEWFFPELAKEVYEKGRGKQRPSQSFYNEFPTLEKYYTYLESIVFKYYPDIYNDCFTLINEA